MPSKEMWSGRKFVPATQPVTLKCLKVKDVEVQFNEVVEHIWNNGNGKNKPDIYWRNTSETPGHVGKANNDNN